VNCLTRNESSCTQTVVETGMDGIVLASPAAWRPGQPLTDVRPNTAATDSFGQTLVRALTDQCKGIRRPDWCSNQGIDDKGGAQSLRAHQRKSSSGWFNMLSLLLSRLLMINCILTMRLFLSQIGVGGVGSAQVTIRIT
jgi:hypothetical protein